MTDAERAPVRRLVAKLEQLERHPTAKFTFERDGVSHDGFVVLFEGRVFAYENRCRHIPISIDYGDNRFFTGDGKLIVCQTHGAIYDPVSGFCVQGPCKGASLFPLKIEVEGGHVYFLGDAK